MKNPKSKSEWQEAVDAAEAALALDSARQYGLMTGGPGVNVDRCLEIKRMGAKLGIRPNPNAVERFARELC